MKYILILLFLFSCLGSSHAQKKYTFNAVSSKSDKHVKKANELDVSDVNRIVREAPDTVLIWVSGHGITMYRDTTMDSLQLGHSKGKHKGQRVLTYRNLKGAVAGDYSSWAALTFGMGSIEGVISTNGKMYNVGRAGSSVMMFEENDIIEKLTFDCQELQLPEPYRKTHTGKQLYYKYDWRAAGASVDEFLYLEPKIDLSKIYVEYPSALVAVAQRCVTWYWELDYDVYLNRGSNLDSVDLWVKAVFNIVQAVYAREGITVILKSTFVWTTPSPYSGNSGNRLTQFTQTRKSWNGDLAHLISFTAGGGVAYVNGIIMCTFNIGQVAAQMGFSGVGAAFYNYTQYSWTINCICHEMAHQLGGQHTHYNLYRNAAGVMGYRMDTCGQKCGYGMYYAGTPYIEAIPVNGGTILSYCHVCTSVGTKITNGFGEQPTATMIANINYSVACLTCLLTEPPPLPCIDTIQTKFIPCPTGTTGQIKQQRQYSCVNKLWGTWKTIDSPCVKKCDTIREIGTKPCAPNQTGIKWYMLENICGVPQDTIITSNTCQDTIPKSCIYKLQGNDTTYYRIVDSLIASPTLKSVNGQYVPYYIQSILTCKTCCSCTNHVYNWVRTRNGVSTKITWTTGNRIYYKNYGTIAYLKGDTLTCTVTSPTHTKTKNCVNALPVSIIIK